MISIIRISRSSSTGRWSKSRKSPPWSPARGCSTSTSTPSSRRAIRWPNADRSLRPRPQHRPASKAIAEARAALVPVNYIERIIQLAQQGFTALHVEEYNTDWTSKAYFTVSGQNSNNSVRVSNAFMDAVQKDGPWPLYWRTEKEKARKEGRAAEAVARRSQPAICGTRSPMPPGPAPTRACSTTPPSTSGTPARRTAGSMPPIRASEYMFLDDTACNLASLNLLKFFDTDTGQLRRRFLPPRLPPLDADPRNLRLHGAVPQRAGGAEVLRLPHARPGLRQPRRAADGPGHPLRFAGRPRLVRRRHRPHARRGLRHVRRNRRRDRARSRATPPTARPCCA